MTRGAKPPGRRGTPWRKRDTRPVTQTGWTLRNGMPWVLSGQELEVLQRQMGIGDAAALVEAVQHCHATGACVPAWVVQGLGQWLAESLASAAPTQIRTASKQFRQWARTYPRALKDWMIADHLETNQRVYGMTRAEALDEASCYFRGTLLSGTPSALEAAWKRARTRGRAGWFQRAPTELEHRELFVQINPRVETDSSRWWSVINHSREGTPRGKWTQRPRLLAHLPLAELERQARTVIEGWHRAQDARDEVRKKTPRKRPDT